MSVTISSNHTATISTRNKKIVLYNYSKSPLINDRLYTKALEHATIMTVDQNFKLIHQVEAVVEHSIRLTGGRYVIVSPVFVAYDTEILTESSPGIYEFIHNGNDYKVEIFSDHFELTRTGSSEVFSSATGEIM